jgi:hypothetical protein
VARQLARRRRHERAAGAAIAALGVVVLVVAIFALRHPRGQGTVAGSDTHVASSSPSVASTGSPTASRSSSGARPSVSARSVAHPSARAVAARLPLVVLNDTAITGLAQQASTTFQARGWSVSQIGNLQNSILSTCAYYDPAVPGARESAVLLQQQFPAIKRVRARFAELPAGPIVVVLTPDYPSG